jgi:PHD/YefM family antitoxin component YafN of YafNO toxin-antitoxin module
MAEVFGNSEELYTVREAERELDRIVDRLETGNLEKLVLTQEDRSRAVLISAERYSELERGCDRDG